ncbi:phosphodiester glycosidase family protein [Paenibacillus sp. MAHUQ-46]|uniref:Phosphodiester glycosidase family protein n=2 Tax=Paenibacillus TaxID=44249 RepID=A0A934J7W4_9BACL|nr:phosphodiester glycosidase family protein [Paenibacillus roseus]
MERNVPAPKTLAAMKKQILIVTLSGALLVQPFVPLSLPSEGQVASAAAAQSPAVKLLDEVMVTSGAKQQKYLWTSTRSSTAVQANVYVLEVDLSNPYVKLDVMSGKNSTVASKNTVTNMVAETKAVAGINADFFIMTAEGVGMGPQISNGNMVTTPSVINGMYSFSLDKNRTPEIDNYAFDGKVTSESGATFALSGINKTNYTMDTANGSQRSHVNALYMYTSAWATTERPQNSATLPTEVLVRNGVVTQIQENGSLPGTVPEDGYILRAHGEAAKFVRENLAIGQRVTADYSLVSLTSGAKKDPAAFQMMVGGHTLLVDNGKEAVFTRDISGVSGNSAVARTAIGYSRDNKKLYLITVEKQGSSSGMTLKELQSAMVSLGIWKGLNLDGGGSTTMVTRPLGDFAAGLTHATSNGVGTSQRAVANGLGIYSIAPQGEAKGIRASGPSAVFVKGPAEFSLKGYDTYYNPIRFEGANATWSAKSLGAFSGNIFTASKPGKTTLTVKSGSASANMDVEVVAGGQIDQMTVSPSSGSIAAGATINLPIKVKLNDGRELTVPAESVTWELKGMKGRVKDGKLTVDSVDQGAANAYAIASYDGYAAMAAFSASNSATSKVWEDFEKVSYPITFKGNPFGTVGSAVIVKGIAGRENSSALQIAYDFTTGAGGRWAYAVLGSNGRSVEGKPVSLTASVYGDGSKNWLRAEVSDAAGKVHYLDLARPLDWTGWKDVKVDLGKLGLSYPISIKQIYVANPESGQEERALTGQVAIDDIKFEYQNAVTTPPASKIELTIGKRSAAVNGKATALDAAPIVLNGTTYVPLRFVSDAIGGQVNWDGRSKRVNLLRGNKMLDLWIGRKEVVLNGSRIKTEVSPIERSGRTLVPVRLVSEQLGLTVTWDNKAQKVTIQ